MTRDARKSLFTAALMLVAFVSALAASWLIWASLLSPEAAMVAPRPALVVRHDPMPGRFRLEAIAGGIVRACPADACDQCEAAPACVAAPLAFIRLPAADPLGGSAHAGQTEMIAALAGRAVACRVLVDPAAPSAPAALDCALGGDDPRRALVAAGLAARDAAACAAAGAPARRICADLGALERVAQAGGRGLWRDAPAPGAAEAAAIRAQTLALILGSGITLGIALAGGIWLVRHGTIDTLFRRHTERTQDLSTLEGVKKKATLLTFGNKEGAADLKAAVDGILSVPFRDRLSARLSSMSSAGNDKKFEDAKTDFLTEAIKVEKEL